MQTLEIYRRQALKLAAVTTLDDGEGYVARIPGFRGLLGTGETKRTARADLETALADWVNLALKRGLGLPRVKKPEAELTTAH